MEPDPYYNRRSPKECDWLKKQNAELTAKLKWYEEQFRLSQQRRFGSSSERTNADQLELLTKPRWRQIPL
ncbi:transposase [Collibacillus ludicampi]|uniref:transposase n=1 Tax=Collibacillus ludicampi TaxID=2771369 RepID=UPI0034E1FE88